MPLLSLTGFYWPDSIGGFPGCRCTAHRFLSPKVINYFTMVCEECSEQSLYGMIRVFLLLFTGLRCRADEITTLMDSWSTTSIGWWSRHSRSRDLNSLVACFSGLNLDFQFWIEIGSSLANSVYGLSIPCVLETRLSSSLANSNWKRGLWSSVNPYGGVNKLSLLTLVQVQLVLLEL